MAKDKKGFILYADQKELFDQLPNDKAGELIKHIFSYVNDEDPVNEDLLINLAFTPIKQQLKRDLKKWESQHAQRVEAGKRSAEVRKRNATSVNERSISSTVNGTVTVNVTDNVSVLDTQKFLEWFNKRRTQYLEIPSNSNRLTRPTEIHLESLKKAHTNEDFEKAMINLCNDQWANESSQVIPSHLLKPDNFTKYLNKEQKPIITKRQKISRGWKLC